MGMNRIYAANEIRRMVGNLATECELNETLAITLEAVAREISDHFGSDTPGRDEYLGEITDLIYTINDETKAAQ